jgi:hypothetical protein
MLGKWCTSQLHLQSVSLHKLWVWLHPMAYFLEIKSMTGNSGTVDLLKITDSNQQRWTCQTSRCSQWPEEGVRPPDARVVVIYLTWVLGSNPRSSARTTNTLNHWVIFSAPTCDFWASLSTDGWVYRQREVTGIWKDYSICQGKKMNISPVHEISILKLVLCTWFYLFHVMDTAGISSNHHSVYSHSLQTHLTFYTSLLLCENHFQ